MADRGFLSLATSKQVAKNAFKIALIVGTLLALINYGDKLLTQHMVGADWLKLGLTYFVPYAVSTFSAVKALQNQ